MKNAICFIVIIISLSSSKLLAQNKMHITEQLLNGTIRIEAINGSQTMTGTGFFFTFYLDSEKKLEIPVIITNKHVVDGSKTIKLFFKKSKNGEPEYGAPYIVTLTNDSSTVIQHPDKNIDLVAIPIAPIFEQTDKLGISLFYISTTEERLSDDSIQKKELKSIENVWMIGYPNGLWDTKNNLPIVREGITATTPYLDYNGKREFLIDIAAFGGSSGSPVFFYRDLYTDKETYQGKIGVKLYLLGVLYAGPTYTVGGKIVKINPTDPISDVQTNIPMNLGYVIKASEILVFKDIFIKMSK
jgi:V8-like Glu-specific endopeptidase